jgi:hypothetical protein
MDYEETLLKKQKLVRKKVDISIDMLLSDIKEKSNLSFNLLKNIKT